MNYISVEKMKEYEQLGNDAGLTFYSMMENAGYMAAKHILRLCEAQKDTSFAIFCGKGNNGGDGFVVARYLSKSGMNVSVILVEGMPRSDDAITNFNLLDEQVIYHSVPDSLSADVVIDAIYGTGFYGSLRGKTVDAIKLINSMKYLGSRIISLDIPSGLSGDVLDSDDLSDTLCVTAQDTIVFHKAKYIHRNQTAKRFIGHIVLADIGIDAILKPAYLINERGYAIPYKHNISMNAKAVCIILHGYGSSMESPTAKMMMKALPKVGISTMVFDLPGHGESFLPMHKLTSEACADDLKAVENFVHEIVPEAAIYYFGSSFGGYTVIRHLGTGDYLGNKAVLRSCAVNMDRIFPQSCNLPKYFEENKDEANRCNILMIHGTADEDVPYEKAKAFSDKYDIPMITIEDGDHRLSKEGMPEKVCQLTIDFFNK